MLRKRTLLAVALVLRLAGAALALTVRPVPKAAVGVPASLQAVHRPALPSTARFLSVPPAALLSVPSLVPQGAVPSVPALVPLQRGFRLESSGALFDGKARKGDAVDDYFGTKVADPYRWLEDPNSEETRAWIEAQNQATEGYLKDSPSRAAVKRRLRRLFAIPKRDIPSQQGAYYVFAEKKGLREQPVLYKSKRLYGRPRVLLDPNELSADGTAALAGRTFSSDKRYLAYAIARKGSDWKEWRVRDVATGRDLPDTILWSKADDVVWHPNGAGFFYARYPAPKEGEAYTAANLNQQVLFHVLGTPQEQDLLVYERPDRPRWSFAPQLWGDHLALYQYEGTEPKNRLFLMSLAEPELGALPLFGRFDASYSIVDMTEGRLLVHTTKDAPNGRLVSLDPLRPQPEHWQDVLPESQDVLETVFSVPGGFVAVYGADGHHEVRLFGPRGGFKRALKLPGEGTVTGIDGRFLKFTSFTQPGTVYRWNFETGKLRRFKPEKPRVDPARFEVERVFYESKDGTRIPMSLVHKKGLKLDGTNPTYLYGYGGFNVSLTPAFDAAHHAWVEMGGVLAVPNLRGGGEYGLKWHDAGRLENKQNVFDDFIAAAEWLIREGYTSREKLAIGGASNGGLLVGAAMTQRPDLFAAALPEVGVHDMLRFHLFTLGGGWRSDYLTSETKAGFETVLKFSPLHNVEPGTKYPATLVLTADHDDRVVPAHSYKLAAALQAAQKGDKPILTRVEADAGHGAGKPTGKRIAEVADMWAFLRKVLGLD